MLYTTETIWLLILLFFSGFFSAAEVALVSVSKLRLQHLTDNGNRRAQTALKLKDEPQRMLTTILVGNNVVNVAAAAMATDLALKIFGSAGVAIATGVVTLALLIFGEIVPKSFATKYNVKMALFFAPFIHWLSVLLKPVIWFFQWLLNMLDKVFKIEQEDPLITEEELKSIVQLGKEEGAIKETERSMIQGVFDIDKTTAEQAMTHKKDMVMANVKASLKDVFPLMVKHQFSRVPVYERSKDNVVGILFVKDLLTPLKENKLSLSVKEIMRKPFFVPESKKLDSLLHMFKKKKEHMAMVVDEHGSIAGLITLEDVLEEIVGEIQDETDDEDSQIKKIDSATWSVGGATEIEDLNEKIGIKIKSASSDTLNGFIQEKTGSIAKVGDVVKVGAYTIIVDTIDEHRVERANITKNSA